jgi:hypothetical protein
MSAIRSRLTFANVAAALALFLSLGAGAYAAASSGYVSGGGTIQGCVKKSALDVVKAGKKCPKHTKSLAFSQRGAIGNQGLRGLPGPPGPNGVVSTYSDSVPTTVSLTGSSAGAPVAVAKIPSLPAGSWLLLAKTSVGGEASAPTSVDISCSINVNQTGFGNLDASEMSGDGAVRAGGEYSTLGSVSLEAPLTDSSASSPSVECGIVNEVPSTDDSQYALDTRIEAIQTTTNH